MLLQACPSLLLFRCASPPRHAMQLGVGVRLGELAVQACVALRARLAGGGARGARRGSLGWTWALQVPGAVPAG